MSEIINVNRSATRAQTLRLVQMASIERPSTTARPSAALAIDTSFGQSAMFIRVASNGSAGSTIILSRDRNEDPSDSPSTSLVKKDAVGTISMEAFTSTERAKIAVVEGAMGPSKTPGLRDMPGTLEFKTSQVNHSTVHTRLFLSDDHMLSVGDDHKFTVKTINGSRLLLFSQDSKGASDAAGGSINVGTGAHFGVGSVSGDVQFASTDYGTMFSINASRMKLYVPNIDITNQQESVALVENMEGVLQMANDGASAGVRVGTNVDHATTTFVGDLSIQEAPRESINVTIENRLIATGNIRSTVSIPEKHVYKSYVNDAGIAHFQGHVFRGGTR